MKIKEIILVSLLLSIVTLLFISCSKETNIYALGSASDLKGKNIPGYWINDKWIYLKNSETLEKSGTYCMLVNNNDVYIGGYIKTESSTWLPGYWKNGEWVELPRPEGFGKSAVDVLEIYNGDIYAAGFCYSDEGNRISGYWKNSEWNSLLPIGYDSVVLNSFIHHDGDIYWSGSKVGYFKATESPGYFINKQWVELPILNNFKKGEVRSVKIQNGDIYALGYCIDNSGNYVPGYWKNGIWSDLQSPIPETYLYVTDLVASEDDIYSVDNRNGYWLNGQWKYISDNTELSYINTVVINDDNIFFAGHKMGNNKFIPCYWKNEECIELNEPVPENKFGDIVHSFLIVERYSNNTIQKIHDFLVRKG